MIYNFDTLIERRASNSIKWTMYPADVLPLWVADMDFVGSRAVTDALQARLSHEIYGYQMDSPSLREVIVERLATNHNFPIDAQDIVFLPGLGVALNLICRTFDGDSVLVTPPIYPPFLSAPVNGGKKAATAPMRLISDGQTMRYQLDFDAMEAAITPNTKIFLFCNPHNPVGRVYTHEELSQVKDFVIKHDLLLVSDEIHCDLVFAPYKHLSIAAEFPELRERTITLLAPSKTFNVAGMGLGFAVVTDEGLRQRLTAAAYGSGEFANTLGYTVAEAAYRGGGEWLEQALSYLKANHDFIQEYVAQNLPKARLTTNEGTYLAWIDFSAYNLPDSPFNFFLERAKVAFNNGVTFGEENEQFIRLNFGCPRVTLEEALDKVCEALQPYL